MVSWKIHDGIVRRLKKVRYISDFRWNLISLSGLDSRGYRTVADGGILKIMHDDKIILEEKKRMKGHYYLAKSPVRDGVLGVRRSPE